MRRFLCSEQDHPECPVQEEGQLRGAESPKRGFVSTRKTDRLHDPRQLSHDTVLDYADLLSVTFHDDNIQEFDTRWDEVLLSMSTISSNDILESLYRLRIRESDQLKTVLELYDMEIHQKVSVPNYRKLKTMVKRSMDQRLRLRNFDARHGRTESGAVVKSRKGLIDVEGGKRFLLPVERKGQCSQGDRCSFRHETQVRAQKPEHTATTPSEPTVSRGRRLSTKRSIRGKVNHGSILRQPCRLFERYLHANDL